MRRNKNWEIGILVHVYLQAVMFTIVEGQIYAKVQLGNACNIIVILTNCNSVRACMRDDKKSNLIRVQ